MTYRPLNAVRPNRSAQRKSQTPVQDCPRCGMSMNAIAGSKMAICGNCGYKEPCC